MGPILLIGSTLYALDGKTGELAMVSLSSKEYKERGRAPVVSGPHAWAPMAYSGGKLVIRGSREIVCLSLR